ncbi:MAG: hypothetical protein LBQ98_08525 [Nitrososphaerota archaeon]|nr:hypothetical protein [Nitrososphaerota archaeon]
MIVQIYSRIKIGCEKNKPSKKAITLITLGVITSLVLIGIYGLVSGFNEQNDALNENENEVIKLPPLQIFSPQKNAIYHTCAVPLNFTGNSATTKITYSLNGAKNVTYTNNTKTFNPYQVWPGIHNLTVYVFDTEGKLTDCQTISFTLGNPQMTQQELQETYSYFTEQGFTFKPNYWWLIQAAVGFESKEAFADFVKSQGISSIKIRDSDPGVIEFYVYVEGKRPIIPDTFSGNIVVMSDYYPPIWPTKYSLLVELV